MSDIVRDLRDLAAVTNKETRQTMYDAADEIERLRDENFSLAAWQCEFTDGKTGLVAHEHGGTYCAMAKENTRLRKHHDECFVVWTDTEAALNTEIERLRAALRNAVMSDTEYCVELERINKALMEAPTVDIDVVVPERDYSQMTPKDCYEAGLLDGVFQAREAIKKAARAALGDTHE